MSAPADPESLARFLRQRDEMGQGPLYLERLDREEALRAARGLADSPDGPDADRSSGSDATDDVAASATADPGYQTVRSQALACTRCRLAEGRTQVVFSDGSPTARVMVVGEAPGAQEDRTGLPFVGPAGKLLDLMLAAVDLSRERNAYICNVLKCRPPGNRDPRPDEIESCKPWLKRQIELVRPEVILGVGSFAARWLSATDSPLGALRGTVYHYEGVPAVVTYHPAALLRNRGWTRPTWNDLQLLRKTMDGT